MSTRNQVLAVFTALIVVCSSGAMAVGGTSGATVSDDNGSGNGVAEGEPIADDEPKSDERDPADERDEDEERDDRPQPAKVTFEDQTTDGDTVVVDEVTMASGGFVAIHDSSLLAGDVIESVIGVSAFLEAGTHEDVEVTLDEPLEEDETLIAMPHRDTNDDREYDFVETGGELDIPYLTPDDEPVTEDAVVSLEEEPVEEEPEPVEEEPAEEPVEEEPEPVEEEIPDDERAIEVIIEQADIFAVEEPKEVDEVEEEPEPVEEEPEPVEEEPEPIEEEPEPVEEEPEPVEEEPEPSDEVEEEPEPVEEEPEPGDEVEEEPEPVEEDEEEPAEIAEAEDGELTPPEGPVGPTGPEKDDEDDERDEDGVEIEGAAEGDVDVDTEESDTAQASLTLEDQASDGEAIEIEDARLPDGGFVAVYDSALLEGQITESFVGVSGFLDAGTHENVQIEPVRSLEDDTGLIAVAHRDTNENQAFDLLETEGQEDGPYLTPDDETVVDDAVIVVENDEQSEIDD